MDLGVFAKTFKTTHTQDLFDKICASHISLVHYNMSCAGLPELPDHIPDKILSEIRDQCLATKTRIVGISATFNMIHPNPDIVRDGLAALEVIAAGCDAIGTDFISLCSGTRDPVDKWRWHRQNSTPQAWSHFLKTLEQAVEIAERHRVFLGIEPETANVIRDPISARNLLDAVRSDRLKIILDPANLFESAASKTEIRGLVSRAIELLASDIGMAHAKDRRLTGELRAPGKGDIDFQHFIVALKETGFRGPVVMHGLSEEEIPDSREYLASCLTSADD